MARPLVIALPPNLELRGGCTIRVTALDPSTGNVVSAVNVANMTMEVDVLSGDIGSLSVGPFLLVPGPRA